MTAKPRSDRAPRLSRRKMRDLLTPVGIETAAAARIGLPANLGGPSLRDVHQSLLDSRGSDLDLDGSNTTHIGGLGLQLLLSAQETWRKDGRSLRVVAASEGFKASLEALGASALVNTQ